MRKVSRIGKWAGWIMVGALSLGAGKAPAADGAKKSSPPAASSRTRAQRPTLAAPSIAAVRRAVEDLAATYPDKYPGQKYLSQLAEIEKQLASAKDPAARDAAEQSLRALQADALLANPLIDFDRLLLVRRDARQMGLPQNWQGNCSLPATGYDNEIAVLSPVRPGGKITTLYKPQGSAFVGDVDLHFDADKMIFSMPAANGRWQIWEIGADGQRLRQVTPGAEPDVNNYDACYLPDGRIIYASTACFHGVPCVGGSDSVANLFRMDADGKNIRQLCFDQDHNWCPTVLPDGRVLYTRWEYSDTAHYFSRLLFRMNPDGTGQMEHYGSNSYWPNSTFYTRPIPNHPTKLVGIISGHHGVPRMGELVIFDPVAGRFEADGAIQRIPGAGQKVEPIIADQLVNGSWPRFLHPYPLSEKHILVSCQPNSRSPWGLYLVDVFDNLVQLAELPGQALLEPIPLRKTPKPPVVPDRVNLASREATVYLSDIYRGPGLAGVPRGTVKKLRLWEFHYSYNKMGGHINVGVEGPWDVRRILGTVPVSEDGSATFKVPANTPIGLQPLDEEGKALQIMRSWFTAMPGETLSCVGCHERQNDVPPTRPGVSSHAPVAITPWRGPARGFSFKRDVQPALDQYCVGCHDGSPASAKPDLAPKARNGQGNFTPAYLALHPYVRRPGPESDYHLQIPLEFHANTSELIQMLRKGHYNVKLDEEAWDRLVTWIDLNVPDHGTWGENHAVPDNFHQRRLEMRTKYANRPEDPEAIPALPPIKATFIKPEPKPEVKVEVPACDHWPFDAAEAQRRQLAASAAIRRTLDLGDGVTIELAYIPAGEFVMGDPQGDDDERPLAKVKIDKPFWMATCEITNRQYARFDAKHHSGYVDQQHKDHTTPGYPAYLPQQPVIRVSWQQAIAFCTWLSVKTGQHITLPTEAQWEWACRAGSAQPFWYGNLDTDFGRIANLGDVSLKLLAVSGVNPQPIKNPSPFQAFLPKDARFDDGNKIQANVGSYTPNPWGLFDMHGNVAEWTRSAYRPYPYRADDGREDIAAAAPQRVVRGGSWSDRPKRARAAFRLPYRPYQGVHDVGFRIIIE